MSPPDTNTKEQAKRHKPVLGGLWLILGVIALLFIGYVIYEIAKGDQPEGADTQVQTGVDTEPLVTD